ncbi:DUF309 domain-containing protein [Marinibacterium profundimaris]|uniref:DUF309 domain-containing protein n=1 Tax=Marinibacterium profundimaris TaxID=1679460 RepID=UPI000B52912C|nr:DUF309 domain-containing protein [Marinibacterium profundimaris]
MTGLPFHAHVPGQTPRHAEGAFDALRATARPGMAPEDLAQSAAFVSGLIYVESGYYWEAQEVLEPVSTALPEGSADRSAVQAVIEIAQARLMARMEMAGAVYRLCDLAEDLADAARGNAMGLNPARLSDWIAATRLMTECLTKTAP